jgi:riboflavin synthase
VFTGLVQHVGVVEGLRPAPGGHRLTIDPRGWAHHPAPGDSIAVAGCCLTLVPGAPGLLAFDVVSQTLAMTTLGTWQPGTRVNLEHAATPATLMGGHLVQGHVEGVARVLSVTREGEGEFAPRRVALRAPPGVTPCLTPQGSVCVDGVSLTIAKVDAPTDWFSVALIPTTLERTTLGGLVPGSACNIEGDMIARSVVQYLRHAGWTPPSGNA